MISESFFPEESSLIMICLKLVGQGTRERSLYFKRMLWLSFFRSSISMEKEYQKNKRDKKPPRSSGYTSEQCNLTNLFIFKMILSSDL